MQKKKQTRRAETRTRNKIVCGEWSKETDRMQIESDRKKN